MSKPKPFIKRVQNAAILKQKGLLAIGSSFSLTKTSFSLTVNESKLLPVLVEVYFLGSNEASFSQSFPATSCLRKVCKVLSLSFFFSSLTPESALGRVQDYRSDSSQWAGFLIFFFLSQSLSSPDNYRAFQ